MRFFTIALSTFACFWVSACTKSNTEGPGASPAKPAVPARDAFLKDVDAAAAGKLVKQQDPPIVLDVRTPEEFAAGHIEGAVNIDFNSSGFKDEVAKLDPEKTYLLHCRSGGRSGKAKSTFTGLGFKAIYHLDGGLNAWQDAGLPTVK
jgi:rhodanese-related sulfurtransferase